MVGLRKSPCSGPEKVFEYLGRYTHRVAISNYRIKSFKDSRVIFTWKDRSQNNATEEMILDVVEFIRGFLLHVLPKGFKKIRHFGFLAPRYKTRNIELRQPVATTMVSGHTGEMRLETGIIQPIISCIRKTKGYLADETCNFDHSP